jgi:hypothetical protein
MGRGSQVASVTRGPVCNARKVTDKMESSLVCKRFQPQFISQGRIMLLAKQDREYGNGKERGCENNDRYVQGVKAGSVGGMSAHGQ